MKKYTKFIFLVLFMLTFLGIFICNCNITYAEEVIEEEPTIEEPLPTTQEELQEMIMSAIQEAIEKIKENDGTADLGIWLEENIMPYVFVIISALIGTGTGLLILKKIIKSAVKGIDNAKNAVSESDLLTRETKESVNILLDSFNEKMNAYQAKIEELEKENENTSKELKESQGSLDSIKKETNALIEMLRILIVNNPEYVKKGYAKEVENIVGALENENKC